MISWCWNYLVRVHNRKTLEEEKQYEQVRHQARLLELEEEEKRINTVAHPHSFPTPEAELAWIKSGMEDSADFEHCRLPDGTPYCMSIPLPQSNVPVKNRYGLDCDICTIKEEKFKSDIVKEKAESAVKRGFKNEICVDCGEIFSTRNGVRCTACRNKFARHGNFTTWAKSTIKRHEKKGFVVEFDFEWLAKLAEETKICPLCKCELVYGKRDFEHMASLDRKDNGTVLTKENVGVICHMCNKVKRDMKPHSVATWANNLNEHVNGGATPMCVEKE